MIARVSSKSSYVLLRRSYLNFGMLSLSLAGFILSYYLLSVSISLLGTLLLAFLPSVVRLSVAVVTM